MKRLFFLGGIVVFFFVSSSWAQKTMDLSIATGGTGGVYYPLGGAIASVLSRHLSQVQATAEVTSASVDNCLLIGRQKTHLALVTADSAWDAYRGKGPFQEKCPIRTVSVLYPNSMHLVAAEDRGIDHVGDLKGKRVSTGSPGSGTERMAIRVLEAFGLDANTDLVRDRWGVSESATAMKDRKIDAFFWAGGLPTSAITDLGTPPGIKIKLIGHAGALDRMREKSGPLYVRGILPAKTYPGQHQDVPVAAVWNLLVCHEAMGAERIYEVLKTLFDHKEELVKAHREARWLSPDPQAAGASPIPYHPGAVRYFAERGLRLK